MNSKRFHLGLAGVWVLILVIDVVVHNGPSWFTLLLAGCGVVTVVPGLVRAKK